MTITISISVVALVFSGISLFHTLRTARRVSNVQAMEKRADAYAALIDARFTTSQIALRLMMLEPIVVAERPEKAKEHRFFVDEANKLEKRLEGDIQALYAAPLEVETIERLREEARGNLAVAKKSLEGTEIFERWLRGS
jgi:hypothetical protein